MQPSLLDVAPHFDGATYEPEQDHARLTRQLDIVKAHMLTHGWQSLDEIRAATGFRDSSISARLRDLRKTVHGGYTVERRRRSAGAFEYLVKLS